MPEQKKSHKISVSIKKHGKGKKIFRDIAERISGSRKNLAKVNLWKLEKLAKTQKGKILVVPGFVLGEGEVSVPLTVAAYSFSKNAAQKIRDAKGKAISLEELAKEKEKTSSMVIIK